MVLPRRGTSRRFQRGLNPRLKRLSARGAFGEVIQMGKTPRLDSLIKELEVNISILKDAVRKGEIKIAEGAHARIEVFTQAIYGSELYPEHEW